MSSHGDEQLKGLLAFSVVLTLVALTGLGGAWATRKWGPQLYLWAVVVDRVVALGAAPEVFLQAMAGLVLGVVLAAFLVRASRAWMVRVCAAARSASAREASAPGRSWLSARVRATRASTSRRCASASAAASACWAPTTAR